MSYTIEQLLWSVRHGAVNVTAETAAFLVLSAAEQMRGAPRLASARGICLVEAGSVVLGDAPAASGQDSDEQLRALLSQLLQGCGGDHPALLEVARARPRSPMALAEELFAALVPMNRSAARRALSRLHKRLDAAGVPAEPSPSPARTALPRQLVEPDTQSRAHSDTPEARAEITPELPTPALPTPALPPKLALPKVELRQGQLPSVFTAPWLVAHTPVIAECQLRFVASSGEPTPFLGSVGVVNAPGSNEAAEETSLLVHERFAHEQLAHELANDTPTLPLRAVAAEPDARPALADASPTAPSASPSPAAASAATAGASPPLVFGRFSSRRSDVKRLLAGFSLETSAAPEGVMSELGRCIDSSATSPPRN